MTHGTTASSGLTLNHNRTRLSGASGSVRPVDDPTEPFAVGVVVAPDDVPADHAGLLLVAGVIGAVEREVPQRRTLEPDNRGQRARHSVWRQARARQAWCGAQGLA